MYTHLYVSVADAERLFEAFAPIGDPHTVVHPTLSEHFGVFGSVPLRQLEASLQRYREGDIFVLKFGRYLPDLPQELIDMDIELVKAEIIRVNSSTTKAKAGYYENPATGFSATVEGIYPVQYPSTKMTVPLYAQNITVCGPSLAFVQEFNTKLSLGFFSRFLVNEFG